MNIDKALRKRLEVVFALLNTAAATRAFPRPSSLSDTLKKLIPAEDVSSVAVQPQVASLFATAAVEMWLRAVHCFGSSRIMVAILG